MPQVKGRKRQRTTSHTTQDNTNLAGKDLYHLKDLHQLLEDLEKVFQAALENGHYAAALKAKELQLKEWAAEGRKEHTLSEYLAHLSDEELESLLTTLEKQIA
jgi:hypothetical protein